MVVVASPLLEQGGDRGIALFVDHDRYARPVPGVGGLNAGQARSEERVLDGVSDYVGVDAPACEEPSESSFSSAPSSDPSSAPSTVIGAGGPTSRSGTVQITMVGNRLTTTVSASCDEMRKRAEQVAAGQN